MTEHILPLGERLAIHRRIAGITHQALADRLGVARQTVVRWERGDRQIDPLRFRVVIRTIETMARDRVARLEELSGDAA